MDGIDWNLDALRKDAQSWLCVHGGLTAMSTLVPKVDVTQKDLMNFLPDSEDAAKSVAEAVLGIQTLVSRGVFRTLEGSQVLREVAAAYAADEEAARSLLEGSWEPETR